MAKCLYCGQEIKPNKKYCSNKCQNDFLNKVDYENKTRICKKCNEIKSFNDFSYRNKEGKLNSFCKKCAAEKMQNYREKNKERHLEYRKERRKNNPEIYREHDRKRRLNPVRKISENVSRGIRYRVSKNGRRSFRDVLPYSVEELFERLKETLPKGLTWEYYIEHTNEYDIDHIIPQSLYNFESVNDEEFLKCWDLKNLRVISKRDNTSKSNFLDIELIKENKIEHLLPKGLKLDE